VSYFRPHVFGVEAEREVSAFVERFELDADDPQVGGMGRGAYSAEGFLRGYDDGNRAAHEIFFAARSGAEPVHSLPRAALERAWRWNYCKGSLQDRFASLERVPCFVPRIILFDRPSGEWPVSTGVIWSDARPIAIPEVDLVILAAGGGRPRWAPHADLGPILSQFELRSATHKDQQDAAEEPFGLAHHMVDYDASVPPPGLLGELMHLGQRDPPRVLAEATVLTHELVSG
jgi:hypothetical protein